MPSPKQMALLRVAKVQLGLSDEDYRAELLRHGGSESARDLTASDFEAVLRRFRQLGFASGRTRRGFGERLGMATDAQVEMIRTLWAEVSGGLPEARLNAWLQHFGVSALRFTTRAKAGKIIAGLRAWQSRRHADAQPQH
jgi:hypothetical protein